MPEHRGCRVMMLSCLATLLLGLSSFADSRDFGDPCAGSDPPDCGTVTVHCFCICSDRDRIEGSDSAVVGRVPVCYRSWNGWDCDCIPCEEPEHYFNRFCVSYCKQYCDKVIWGYPRHKVILKPGGDGSPGLSIQHLTGEATCWERMNGIFYCDDWTWK